MFPDYLQQGWGFSPPVDVPEQFGGLHPSVAQALGLAPPQPAPPPQLAPPADAPPVQPLQLPSAAEQPATPQSAPSKDFQVPVTAIDGPGTKPPASAQPQRPAKPPTSDQLAVQAQQKQDTADQAQQGAIRESEMVQRAQAADEQQVFAAHDERAKQLEQEQKAFRDDAVKIRAQKEAYAKATLQKVDDYKIDQNKFMNDMGMGQALGWGIGAALATMGDALRGVKGPNPVIQMMQAKMAEAVRAQIDERDQLKERAGRAEHALDRYDVFTKDKEAAFQMRMAEGERMLGNVLRSTAAKYKDATIQAGADAEAAKLYQSSADRAMKAVDSAATREHQQKQLQIAGFQASEAARHNKAMEDLTSQQRDIEAAKAARAGQADQAKLIRERALGGDVVTKTNPDGTVTKSTDLIRMKDGQTVFIPQGTETNVTKLQEQHKASLQLLGTIDEIMRLGPEWLTNTANSEKKQRLDELMGAAKLQAIAANNLGVPTGKDVELATATIGSPDPTRFRDSLAGLQQGRATIIRNHNQELKAFGLDRPWEPEDNSKPLPAPAATPVDKLVAIASGSRGDAPGALPGTPVDPDYDPIKNPVKPTAQDTLATQRFPKMANSQRQALETFAAWLRSDDPTLRKRGADILGGLAGDENTAGIKEADEKGVRDYAQYLLQQNVTVGAQPTFTEQTTTATRSPAFGSSQGAPPLVVPPQLTPQNPALSRRGP